MNQTDFLSMFDDEPADEKPAEQVKAEPPTQTAPKTEPAPPPTAVAKSEPKSLLSLAAVPVAAATTVDHKFAIVLAMCANPAYAALDSIAFVSRAEAILANLGAE